MVNVWCVCLPFHHGLLPPTACLRPTMRTQFTIRDSFPAAHRIRIDTAGTLEPVHVHHWRVEACFEPPGDALRASVEAQKIISRWVRRHRGRSLNDVPPFDRVNPTAEEVARELFGVLARELPDLPLRYVQIGEAAGFSATYLPPAHNHHTF